jgi:hypothetical protein
MGNASRAWGATPVLLLLCLLAGPAAAQRSRKPEAEAAFNQGKELMARGEYDAACQKFEVSNALDPRASTLMNLGACREAQQKLVSAWYAFTEAQKLALASKDETGLADPSKLKAAGLAPRLSSIEIVVSASARVPGLEVMLDGEKLLEGQWNSPIPIDGGEYTVEARARGTDAWTNKVAVASEREKKQVEIPVLKPADTPAETPTETPKPIDDPVDDPETPRAAGSFTGMRKAAVGLAVVGVAALAGGAVFGMKASGKQSDADEICPERVCNDPEGLRLNDEAQDAAGTANLLLIGGGVAVAGGVALWILGAPKSVAPTASDDMVGLTFRGEF